MASKVKEWAGTAYSAFAVVNARLHGRKGQIGETEAAQVGWISIRGPVGKSPIP